MESSRRQQLYQQTRSVLFALQVSIIQQLLNRRILALLVVQDFGRITVLLPTHFVHQLFVQQVAFVLVMELWVHVVQENSPRLLDCRLTRNVLFVMQVSIIQQQLSRPIHAELVVMATGVYQEDHQHAQMYAEQATTAQEV